MPPWIHRSRIALAMLALFVALTLGACLSAKDSQSSSSDEGQSAGEAKMVSASQDSRGGSAFYGEETRAAPVDDRGANDQISAGPRLVIYNAWMTLASHDVAGTLERARAIVVERGGFVQTSSMSQLVLRIPAASYEDALALLKDMAELRSISTSSEDVTEAFLDLSARLDNLQVLEQRYLQLLAEATEMATRLTIERELRRITRELRELEERLAYLSDQIALATITLDVEAISAHPLISQRPAQPFDFVRDYGVAALVE